MFKTIEECDRKFDVITLFRTFEHLPNPRMWLDKFSNYLVPNEKLIIEVPNVDDILLPFMIVISFQILLIGVRICFYIHSGV